MLELLLYCRLFAKLRFAGEIAIVTDAAMELVERAKAHAAHWLPRTGYGRKAAVPAFGFWNERDVVHALDRLNAYVASAA
jgi:hypothetical protein